MPNRNIKESCRSSATLDALSAEAERMFFRLTTLADDYGRFEADPVLLLAGCFPRRVDGPKRLKASQVKEWRDEMVAVDLIRLYESGGKLYGYLPTWIKHQGKPRAQQSKHPEPQSEPELTLTEDRLQASANICEQMPANVLVSRSPIPGTTILGTTISDNDLKQRGDKTAAKSEIRNFQTWAKEQWDASGNVGDWSDAEWTCLTKGYKAIGDDVKARASWTNFLRDPSDFYRGHYPKKWASEPSRWLEPRSTFTQKTISNIAAGQAFLKRMEDKRGQQP